MDQKATATEKIVTQSSQKPGALPTIGVHRGSLRRQRDGGAHMGMSLYCVVRGREQERQGKRIRIGWFE